MHIDRMKRIEFLDRKSRERVEYFRKNKITGSSIEGGTMRAAMRTAKSSTTRRNKKVTLPSLLFLDNDND